MAKVREPPHVAQANAEAHLGQHVLNLGIPGWPVPIVDFVGIRIEREVRLRLTLGQPCAILVGIQRRFLRLGNKYREKKKPTSTYKLNFSNVIIKRDETLVSRGFECVSSVWKGPTKYLKNVFYTITFYIHLSLKHVWAGGLSPPTQCLPCDKKKTLQLKSHSIYNKKEGGGGMGGCVGLEAHLKYRLCSR